MRARLCYLGDWTPAATAFASINWVAVDATTCISQLIELNAHPERYASERTEPLEPGSRFVVRLSDSEVVCERPDGKVERVAWADDRGWAICARSVLGSTWDGWWARRTRKAPLVTVTCSSDSRRCPSSTIAPSSRRCPRHQPGGFYAGRNRHNESQQWATFE